MSYNDTPDVFTGIKSILSELTALLETQTQCDPALLSQINDSLVLLSDISFVLSIHTSDTTLKSKFFDVSGAQTNLLYDWVQNTKDIRIPIEYHFANTTQYKFLKVENRLEHPPNTWLTPNETAANVNQFLENAKKEKWVSKQYAQKLSFQTELDKTLLINQYDEVCIPKWHYSILKMPFELLQDDVVIIDMPNNYHCMERHLQMVSNRNHLALFLLSISDSKDEKTLNSIKKQAHHIGLKNCYMGLYIERDIEGIDLHNTISNLRKQLAFDNQQISVLVDKTYSIETVHQLQDISSFFDQILLPKRDHFITNKISASLYTTLQQCTSFYNNHQIQYTKKELEYKSLIAKKETVADEIKNQIKQDTQTLSVDIEKHQILKSIFNREIEKLTDIIGGKQLINLTSKSKHQITNSSSANALHEGMKGLFNRLQFILDQARFQVEEIGQVADQVLCDLAEQHDIHSYTKVSRIKVSHHQNSLLILEKKYENLPRSKKFFFKEQKLFYVQFHNTICEQAKLIFIQLCHEAYIWEKELTLPLEYFIDKHHYSLQQHLEKLKRTLSATDVLKQHLEQLTETQSQLSHTNYHIQRLSQQLNKLNPLH